MPRLFGTDGIRGIANKEITCELAMNIGRTVAAILIDKTTKCPKIIIGKDTRVSSDMLEGALIAGICSAGADAVLLGVVPTPAVAFLVGKYKADAGIMISASHNSYEFNGIKIFNGDGYKLPDEFEDRIESILFDAAQQIPLPKSEDLGRVHVAKFSDIDYIEHIKSTVPFAIDGLRIALDCANGSACRTAEKLFTALGAQCHMLSCSPSGTNINENCGSTNLNQLIKYVKEHKLDGGIAFDGDADRCLAIDEKGYLIDGDLIMAIVAIDMKSRGKLAGNTVVGTVMTNMGFNRFCSDNGINFVSTKVGDRYVLEEMLKEKYSLGGEQSGHVIFLDFATTGDGQLTAVQLLSILKRRGARLSSLAQLMGKYPQKMINIKVKDKAKDLLQTDSQIKNAIEFAENQLGKNGRVVVRRSGTEPLIRIMVEGQDETETVLLCEKIAKVLNTE